MNITSRVSSHAVFHTGGPMEKLNTLSYQDKEQLLMHLGRVYRKGRFQAEIAMKGIVEDCSANDQDMELAAKIRLLLQQMDRRLALILLNDFFELKQGDWWKQHFAKTTYYRYKKVAIDHILQEIYEDSF